MVGLVAKRVGGSRGDPKDNLRGPIEAAEKNAPAGVRRCIKIALQDIPIISSDPLTWPATGSIEIWSDSMLWQSGIKAVWKLNKINGDVKSALVHNSYTQFCKRLKTKVWLSGMDSNHELDKILKSRKLLILQSR